jgi:hypothetical protein
MGRSGAKSWVGLSKSARDDRAESQLRVLDSFRRKYQKISQIKYLCNLMATTYHAEPPLSRVCAVYVQGSDAFTVVLLSQYNTLTSSLVQHNNTDSSSCRVKATWPPFHLQM